MTTRMSRRQHTALSVGRDDMMTDNEAVLARMDVLVPKWKRILRLENWDITWEIVRLPNNDPDALMSVSSVGEVQSAHISISPECGDLPMGNAVDDAYNLETLAVHELLHVVMEDVGMTPMLEAVGATSVVVEAAIERLAQRLAMLFVDLDSYEEA